MCVSVCVCLFFHASGGGLERSGGGLEGVWKGSGTGSGGIWGVWRGSVGGLEGVKCFRGFWKAFWEGLGGVLVPS